MRCRSPSSCGTKPYPAPTQSNQHHFSFSFPRLLFALPSVIDEDKDPGSPFLSSPSDKLEISHRRWERLPSTPMLEALLLSYYDI